MRIVKEPIEFEWDKGNFDKNRKHGVENKESEESFFDKEKVIYKDIFHSDKENRFILLGKTKQRKLLYTVFTYRKNKIRIISSRKVDRKEAKFYEKKAQTAKIHK